jgi:uncharacterized protein
MPRLSDADIDRLDAYLGEHCGPFGGLPDAEALDGLLSAVVVAPEPIEDEEWLDSVFGAEHAFADEATAEEMLGLVKRAHAMVILRIDLLVTEDDPGEDILPIIGLPELDPDDPDDALDLDDTSLPIGALWATGFMLGCGLRDQAWDARIDEVDGLVDDLADLDSLRLGFNPDDPDDVGPTLGERLDIVSRIPALLLKLYADDRQPRERASAPFRRESPKVGRNDPCPCGSGRKYKHCHGAGQ